MVETKNNLVISVSTGNINDRANEGGIVKSADRVLDLFELLAGWGNAMSHSEISQALQIPKGSLSKLLKNLVDRRYVEYLPESKGYRLGDALVGLANTSMQAKTLVELAEPLLRGITEQTLESCALSQLRVDQVEVVASVTSPQRLLSHLRTGDLAPLYAVSGGKAILAFLPEQNQADYLASVVFEPHTPSTLNSRERLIHELGEIKKTGIAYSFEEFTPGIIGIGVPVLSASSYPLGALNIAMPAVRFTEESKRLAIAALAAAATLLQQQIIARANGITESYQDR